jgi:hypothetical protein
MRCGYLRRNPHTWRARPGSGETGKPACASRSSSQPATDTENDLLRFTARLRARRLPRLDIALEVYPNEYHATVPALILAHGPRRFFSGR